MDATDRKHVNSLWGDTVKCQLDAFKRPIFSSYVYIRTGVATVLGFRTYIYVWKYERVKWHHCCIYVFIICIISSQFSVPVMNCDLGMGWFVASLAMCEKWQAMLSFLLCLMVFLFKMSVSPSHTWVMSVCPHLVCSRCPWCHYKFVFQF